MVDMYTDKNNLVLKDFLKKNPEYLGELQKEASDSELISADELTNEAFIDKTNRMFPAYSKESASISALYIMAQEDEIPDFIKQAAQERCDLFDLDFDLIGFKKVASAPAELTETDFIFPEKRKLPVVDEETFYASQNVFLKVANELSPEDLILGARRLIKKANEFNVDYNEQIELLAIKKGIDRNKLEKVAEDRYFNSFDNGYLQVKEVVKTASTEELPTLLMTIMELDKHNNISKVSETLQKVASDNNNGIIIIGNIEIPEEKVASIPADEWKDVLPYEELGFLADGEFNKEAFEEEVNNFTPHEMDIITSFIQKYL